MGHTISNEKIAEALKISHGNLRQAAELLGCSRQTVWKRVNQVEELAQIVHDEREGLKDIAEDALYTAVENGEPWAIQFCLKGVGKDRGHNEKIQQEVTGAGGGAIRITTLSDERLAELLMKSRKPIPDVNN